MDYWQYEKLVNQAWGQSFVTPPDPPVRRPVANGIAERIRHRKLVKRGMIPAERPVEIFVDRRGDPRLPDGVYEIYRSLQGSPVGLHYGILVVSGGFCTVYDLRQGEPPREITIWEFADGHRIFTTVVARWGAQMTAALLRLQDARVNYAEWNLWSNNCEHFSRYVVRGKRESTQINGLKAIGVCVAVCAILGA